MRKTYAFAVPGMPFDGNTLYTSSLGGSESAALYLARELAKTNEVYVFSNCDQPVMVDGVQYFPISMWRQFALTTPHDVHVAQRLPDFLSSHLTSRLNMLWLHDLGQKEVKDQYKGVLWNLDRIACVSGFHRQQLVESMDLPEDQIWVGRNGIDTSAIPPQRDRDRFKIMYAARPERGLDNLLRHVLPAILEREPRAHLCIAGYDNNVEQWQQFYDEQKRLAEHLPVTWLGCLTKAELYEHYVTAGAYVYPTPSPVMPDFREVSCITAMECQACGLPFIASNTGALPDTLQYGGILLGDSPVDNPDAWADAVADYMHDDDLFFDASWGARQRAHQFDWGNIAAEWDAEVERLIDRNNDDPDRLISHFIRRSDIEAARYVSDENDLHWDFSPWEHGDAQHKPEQPGDGGNRPAQILNLMREYEPNMVLDFGCAQGGFTHAYAEAMPQAKFLAVDLEPRNIAEAHTHERIEYAVGSEYDLPDDRFDLALACEVLEHQARPWETLERIERSVKNGGHVIITVPYGPWEFTHGEYWHRWEFDPNDLSDMIGTKPQRSVGYYHVGAHPRTSESLGWYLITYQVDHEPIPEIDLERKIRLQKPRQTVSACLIAGPGSEDALRLNLNSYAYLCDEIVVGDTGISDECRRIFEEYGARFIDAPVPTEAGFDAARNAALAHCTKDWVLWIDTDEHLIEPENLTKYLRENIYNGYGIQQHHFAVDTTFPPDMPVRLFRNRLCQGKHMHFHGRIHEHPELEMNEGPGPVVVLSDVHIAHYGYMAESIRQNRFWRNLPLLEKDRRDYPDRLLQKHFVCRDNVILAGYIMASHGLTEKAEKLCREVIEVYREHFMANQQFLNIDTSVYYHQALELLGEGFEFESDLLGGKRRFASREDLDRELHAALDKRLG